MNDARERPKVLVVPMTEESWRDLDELVELSRAANMSAAVRSAVREMLLEWRRKVSPQREAS